MSARYDAALADETVYATAWFAALLALFGAWMVAHVLIRRPWSGRNTGLWIAAGGLAVLLLGAGVTRLWAVRGTLDLSSGQRTDEVVLEAAPELEAPGPPAPALRVTRRLRYAERVPTFRSGPAEVADTAVSFRVETLFGASTRWLSSASAPEIDLGDAHLVLVAPDAELSPAPGRPATLELRRTEEDGWRSVALDALPVEVDGLKISLVRVYEQAIVNAAGSGMSEGGAHGSNPALELSVASQGQTVREVLYAKFPDFTLSPSGVLGHKFRYAPALAPAPRTGNVIECQVEAGAPDRVRMRVLKLGTELVSQALRPGETLSTPWSGIQLTLMELVSHAVRAEEVRAIEPLPGRSTPPSAVEVVPAGAPPEQGFWLVAGDSRSIPGIGTVRFGPPRLKLPVQVALKPSASAVAEMAMEVTPPGLTVHLHPGVSTSVSGYDLAVGERPAVVRIARDPGQPLLYVGSVGVLVGLIVLARARKAAR